MADSESILNQWDQSLSAQQHVHLQQCLDRRRFLHSTIKASAGVLMLPGMALLSACQQDKTPASAHDPALSDATWRTFAAVQQILFPDDGNGPGAVELHATAYLKFVLTAKDTDSEERDFIYQGIGWLDKLSETEHNLKFIDTTAADQAKLIDMIAKSSSGERWLSYLLLYIFEALLTDPIYGANPQGIGWRWLQHQAGYPTPPSDKIYTKLLLR